MPGAGASSITFWWRRCSEQSRSKRCTHIAVRVGEDLHLDVARREHVFLDQHARIAEGRSSPRAARFRARHRTRRPVDAAHALAAAARHRLDQHRIADLVGLLRAGNPAPAARRDSPAPPARRPSPSAPWPRPSAPWRGWRRAAGRRRRCRPPRRPRRIPHSPTGSRSPDGCTRRPAFARDLDDLVDVEIALARRRRADGDAPRRPAAHAGASRIGLRIDRDRCACRAACAVRMMRQAISPRLAMRTEGSMRYPSELRSLVW